MQKPFENRYNADAIEDMDMDFISIECLEKLGLEQNPFIDHARDPFIFIDKQLEMSMNVLMDYLLNQNSTIVLLGEVGIGKTTHLRMLLRKGYQQFNFCTLRAKPKTTFADIEQKIKERWQLSKNADEDPDLLDTDNEPLNTSEHIKQYIEDEKHPVLIIDDAHRLENNVLDELLKLKHHVGLQSDKAMGLVLAAEPNVQTQLSELEQTNPAATQIYQVNVRSFDASQCEDYLNYRLEQAGASSQDIFSPSKITEIYSKSKGLPKYINKLAREELSYQCEHPSSTDNKSHKFQSSPGMRLGLILAGLIGLAVIFSALIKNSDDSDEPIELDISKPKLEQEIEKPKLADKSEKTPTTETKKLEVAEKEKQTEKPIAKPYVAPLVLGPLQKDKSEVEKDAKANKKPKEKPTITTKTTEALEQKTTQNSDFSSDWIIKQDPSSYTIQIVASPNEKNLLDFINKHSLIENTAYYQKSSADKTWYVLVHGSYTSREEALKGIEQLSDALKKNTPYPIQIKYLQELINKQ